MATKVFSFNEVPDTEKERVLFEAAKKGIKDPAEIRVILSDDNKPFVTDTSNPLTTFVSEFAANVPSAGVGTAGGAFARAKAAARLKNPVAIGAATLAGAVAPAILSRVLQDKAVSAVAPEAEAVLAEGRQTNPNAALLGQLSSGFLFGSPFKPGSLGNSRLGRFVAPAVPALEALQGGALSPVSASKPLQRLLGRFAIPGATQAGVDVASQAAEQGTVDPRKFTLDKKRTALATLTGLLQMNPTAAGRWAANLGLKPVVPAPGGTPAGGQTPLGTTAAAERAFIEAVKAGKSYDEAFSLLPPELQRVGELEYFGQRALQQGVADDAAKQELARYIIAIRGGLNPDLPQSYKQLVALAKLKGQTGVELTPEDTVNLWLANPAEAQKQAALKLSEMDQAQQSVVGANRSAALEGDILNAADQLNAKAAEEAAAKAAADKAALEAQRAAAAPAIVNRAEETFNPPTAMQNAKHAQAVEAYRKAEKASIGKEGEAFTKEEQARLNDIARSRELLLKYGEDPELSSAFDAAEAKIVEAAKARIAKVQEPSSALWVGTKTDGSTVYARTLAELQTLGELNAARRATPEELADYNKTQAEQLPKKAEGDEDVDAVNKLLDEVSARPEVKPEVKPETPAAPPEAPPVRSAASMEELTLVPRDQGEQPSKAFSMEDKGQLFHGKPQEYSKGTQDMGPQENRGAGFTPEQEKILEGLYARWDQVSKGAELSPEALRLENSGTFQELANQLKDDIINANLGRLERAKANAQFIATMEEPATVPAKNLRGSPAGLPAKPGSVEADVVRPTTPEEALEGVAKWELKLPKAQRERLLQMPEYLNRKNADPVALFKHIKDRSLWSLLKADKDASAKAASGAPKETPLEFTNLKTQSEIAQSLRKLVNDEEVLALISKKRSPDEVAADLVMEDSNLGTEQQVSSWITNILNGKQPKAGVWVEAPPVEKPAAAPPVAAPPVASPPVEKPVASMETKSATPTKRKPKAKDVASMEDKSPKSEAAKETTAADSIEELKAKLKKLPNNGKYFLARIALKEKIAALEQAQVAPKPAAPKPAAPEEPPKPTFDDVAKFLGYKDTAEMSADTGRLDDVVLRTEDDSWANIQKSNIPDAGDGLFTRQVVAGKETMFPVQIGNKRTYFGTKINHSDTPNAEVVKKGGNLWLKAKHDLPKGTELTIDYIEANNLRREYLGKQGTPLKTPGPQALGIKPAPLFSREQIGAPFRLIGKAIDAVWTKRLGSITQKIARMDIPEAAKNKLLQANQTLQRYYNKALNAYDAQVYAAKKVQGLEKDSVERILQYADDMDIERGGIGKSAIKLTPAEQQALDHILTAHKMTRFDQRKYGMEVAGRQGGVNPWYINHMMDPDVLHTLRNANEGSPELLALKKAWDQRATRQGGMSQTEADELFNKFREVKDSRNPEFDIFNPYFAPLVEAQNRMGLPMEWRDKSWNGFLRYMRKAALGIAEWRVKGDKNNPEARAISQLLHGTNPDEKFFEPGSGTYGKLPVVGTKDEVRHLQQSWEALTGGRTGILDKLNSLGSALYVQFPAKVRDAFGTVATASELFDLSAASKNFEDVLARAKKATESGAVPLRRSSEWMADKDLQHILTDMSSGVRIASGNESIERGLRQLAYGLGHWNAEQWVKTGNEAALNKLFGHKGWKVMDTEDLLEAAGHQAVQRLQGKYGNEGLSHHFFQGVDDTGANAFLRFMTHYTRFAVERSNNWRDTVWKAAEEGNLKPLLISSGFHVLTGAAYSAFMSALLGKKPQEQTWKEFINSGRKDVWRWALNMAQPLGWAGMFGWGLQALANANRNVNVRTPEAPLYILANNIKTRLGQAQAARVSDGRDLIDLIGELGWTLVKDNFQNVNTMTFEDTGQRDERMMEQAKGNIKYVPQGITDNPFSTGAVLRNKNTSDEKAARAIGGYLKARGEYPRVPTALRNDEYYKFIEQLRGKEESQATRKRDFEQERALQQRYQRAVRLQRRGSP